jgi:hypothetical protein
MPSLPTRRLAFAQSFSLCRLVLGFVFWSFFALFASLLYVL